MIQYSFRIQRHYSNIFVTRCVLLDNKFLTKENPQNTNIAYQVHYTRDIMSRNQYTTSLYLRTDCQLSRRRNKSKLRDIHANMYSMSHIPLCSLYHQKNLIQQKNKKQKQVF